MNQFTNSPNVTASSQNKFVPFKFTTIQPNCYITVTTSKHYISINQIFALTLWNLTATQIFMCNMSHPHLYNSDSNSSTTVFIIRDTNVSSAVFPVAEDIWYFFSNSTYRFCKRPYSSRSNLRCVSNLTISTKMSDKINLILQTYEHNSLC